MILRRLSILCLVVLAPIALMAQAQKPKPAAPAAAAAQPASGPQLVIDTVKGQIVIQLFESEAPKSVAQVTRLAKEGFYRSQRIFRVVPKQIVQFGDKQTRNFTLREWWGRGPDSGTGKPIGVAEISKTRKHKAGSVGMAHAGDPRASDSQVYIVLRPMPQLDGKHAIIGQVTTGLDVVSKLQVEDMIKEVTVRAAGGT
jgi:peptidyl-prolyl cis-trans isomerase B (cyclophilin B)